MIRTLIAAICGLGLACGTSAAHADGKLALARKAVLKLPGVAKLRAGQSEPADIDKAMRIHFSGDKAFLVSVAEDADLCRGCERVYVGRIAGGKVALDLVGPEHPDVARQVKHMPNRLDAFNFSLAEGRPEVLMAGYGGAQKPFKLLEDGTLKGGPAFREEDQVRLDGQVVNRPRRVRIPE
jgi:hypothetical protein